MKLRIFMIIYLISSLLIPLFSGLKMNSDMELKKLESENKIKEISLKQLLIDEKNLIEQKIETLQKEMEILKRKKILIENEIKKFDKGDLEQSDANKENHSFSSFIESSLRNKADPLFKTMSFGFPIPRKISFTGSPSK